jgi:hypothetical protein
VNGPEHYKEAERLGERAWHYIYGDGNDAAVGQAIATLALVHATLAQTAATVARTQTRSVNFEDADYRTGQESMTEPDSHEWGIAQGREGS